MRHADVLVEREARPQPLAGCWRPHSRGIAPLTRHQLGHTVPINDCAPRFNTSNCRRRTAAPPLHQRTVIAIRGVEGIRDRIAQPDAVGMGVVPKHHLRKMRAALSRHGENEAARPAHTRVEAARSSSSESPATGAWLNRNDVYLIICAERVASSCEAINQQHYTAYLHSLRCARRAIHHGLHLGVPELPFGHGAPGMLPSLPP